MSLLPIFLKLDGRPGLLVGAGKVALEKIGSLLNTGLRLRVIAPAPKPEIRRLAGGNRLEWIGDVRFRLTCDGNFVVIAATDDPEVNAAVYREAVRRGIPWNSVDDPPHCDFYFGSVVRRGDLQIAISTAGESPAFAQRLRREIDARLSADIGPWLKNLGEFRREVVGDASAQATSASCVPSAGGAEISIQLDASHAPEPCPGQPEARATRPGVPGRRRTGRSGPANGESPALIQSAE